MADRLGLLEDDEKPRGPRLKRILQRIYSDVNPNEYFERYNRAKEFFRLKLFDGVSIITTNYDLNIESTLYWLDKAATLPFEFQEKIDYEYVGSLYNQYCGQFRKANNRCLRCIQGCFQLTASLPKG